MLKIRGPVFPIPTAFKENEEVDYESIKNYVQFLLESGCKNILITVGTSRFNLLSNEEIIEVNKVAVETVKSLGGNVIVTNGLIGPLKTSLNFIESALKLNADAMMIYYPERYYDDESIVDFYKELLQPGLPLMIHEMPMKSGTSRYPGEVQYSLGLIEKLFNLPNVIGMKEESGVFNHSVEILKKYSDSHSIILAGAAKKMTLSLLPFGANTYLVGVGSFAPKIALKYWGHIQNKNYEEAVRIEKEFEAPFFEAAFPLGWHICMKESLEYLNLMPKFERRPLKSLKIDDAATIHKVIEKISLKEHL